MRNICALTILALSFVMAGDELEKLYLHSKKSWFGEQTWGLCDSQGNMKVPHKYTYLTNPDQGGVSVGLLKSGEKFLLVNGKEKGPINCDDIVGSSEGLSAVRQDGKWGYIDSDLRHIIKPEYEQAGIFRDGYAKVKKNGKWSYINPQNKAIGNFIYDEARDFYDGYAVVKKDGFEGVIDHTGKLVIPLKYKRIGRFGEGLFPASRNDREWFFLDPSDKPHLQNNYAYLRSFVNGIAIAQDQKGKYGAIDKTGKVIIPFNFSGLSDFSGAFYAYGVGKRPNVYYGFMDGNGKKLTSPRFRDAMPSAGSKDIFTVDRKMKTVVNKTTKRSTLYIIYDSVNVKVFPDGKIIYFE